MTKPFVIDFETGIHNRGEDAIGNMKASPFHPDNHIVWVGHQYGDATGFNDGVAFKGTAHAVDWGSMIESDTQGNQIVWVGHNIKFDLLYLMKDYNEFRSEIWPKIRIWDTMLAEYILSGQVKKYPSLDLIAPKYGGHVKDNRLKDLWDNDVDTETIDPAIIQPYLKGDLSNTMKVYKGQVDRAIELGMYPLIVAQMKGLKATTEMEWNGMAFDKKGALERADKEKAVIDIIELETKKVMWKYFDKLYVPSPMSPKDMRLMLFGGTYEVDDTEIVIDPKTHLPAQYKTGPNKGKVKRRKCKRTVSISGFNLPVKTEYQTTKGNMASNEKTMEMILRNEKLTADMKHFINRVLLLRQKVKDVSTYYEGYSKLVWPDGLIHHSLNHVSTDTGRLSSSNPNLQNVSRKEE